MLVVLASDVDKLQVSSSDAADLDVVCTYTPYSEAAPPVPGAPDRQLTQITTATTADVLGAPAGSGTDARRALKFMTVTNKDSADTTVVTVLYNSDGTQIRLYQATLRPGETLVFAEGVGFAVPDAAGLELMRVLSADDTGANVNTAQPWFPTNGAVTVEADTTYRMQGAWSSQRAAGTTSHTTGISFGGTATVASIRWWAQCGEGDVATLADSDLIVHNATSNLQVKAASTSSSEFIKLTLDGIVRFSAAGTFIPQFTYSSAPGGAPTIHANSFFRLCPLGSAAFNTQGPWS